MGLFFDKSQAKVNYKIIIFDDKTVFFENTC
jgi:hypothetical protein